MYKLQQNGVKRLSDNSFIPEASGNRDWQEFQEWLDKGNTPEPQFTREELEQKQRRESIRQRRKEIEEDLKNTKPSQSVPGLAERVENLEIILRIKEPEIL